MANIITEIYVSIDGLEYTKLDLHKDESISMNYKQKDLQDLSKIFAPYSQDFTFPATPKNRRAFGFFGDTDVIKVNNKAKFSAKSYINGILNNTGFIKLTNLSYKNNKPEDFTGSFATTMTNLKDRIGEDLISELADEPVLVKWDVESVQNMVRSSQTKTVNGVNIKYFVPLISINRVWGYDLTENSLLLDNIAYRANADLKGNNLIRPEELRPAIMYSSIMELIKKKYNLTVISPLENREEYLDARVWCNAERISSNDFQTLPVLKAFGGRGKYDTKNEGGVPSDKKYSISANLNTNVITVHKSNSSSAQRNEWVQKAFQFCVKFNGVQITGDSETPEVSVQYVRASDDVVLSTGTFQLENGVFDCVTQIDDSLFGALDDLAFYIKVKFEQPTNWSTCDLRIFWRYYDGKTGFFSRKVYAWYYHDSLNNNNSPLISTNNVDLFKTLPEMKVIDFLNSHFKSFNISVLDTSPNNEDLYWLTPQDINSSGKVYSKAVLNYTPYVDSKEHNKEKPNDYNYYNFKHAESSYFSNKKYKEAFGLEYGQTVYPEVKPTDINEFKVETDFSIIPPVQLKGAGIFTAYGFTNDAPEVIETGEARYSPNYDELTVFYTHGSTSCAPLGMLGMIQKQTAPFTYTKVLGVLALTSYIKVMPWSKNGYSFGFSVLKNNNIEYNNSLYLRYYSEQTARLLDANVLSQKFSLILPPNEIYLNEATSVQGSGATPSGFRLQNDIIIGENLFSIVDATIDQTTGKTKMTLLNY